MVETLSKTEEVWPQTRNRFCYRDVVSLICAILRWKERNPQTVVISIQCWEEESEERALWCEVTHITPGEG